MNKFTIALREISTFKELLRSQVEHMIDDRLLQIVNVDINEVKEARKRFDKVALVYDQAREKFMSLRKSTKVDITTVIEEELRIARTSFEEARFSLVGALNNIEIKKIYEFLEVVTGVMDAHLRYFQQIHDININGSFPYVVVHLCYIWKLFHSQGYHLLHQMEPFVNEVLDYVQQSKESFDKDQVLLFKRMQEYKKRRYAEANWLVAAVLYLIVSENGRG